MIGIKDMKMPKSCRDCPLTYIDECGDFKMCGIMHNCVVALYDDERIIEQFCPLIEIDEKESEE